MDNDVIASSPGTPIQTSPTVQASHPQSTQWGKVVMIGTVAVLVVMGSVLVGIQIGKFQQLDRQGASIQEPSLPSSAAVESTPSPSQNMTVGWKRYSNDTYRFAFLYPPDWSEKSPIGMAYPEGYMQIGGNTKEELVHINVVPFSGTVSDLLARYQENPSLFGGTNWGELGTMIDQRRIGALDVSWYERNATAMAGDTQVRFIVTNILFVNGTYGFLINTQLVDKAVLASVLSTISFY